MSESILFVIALVVHSVSSLIAVVAATIIYPAHLGFSWNPSRHLYSNSLRMLWYMLVLIFLSGVFLIIKEPKHLYDFFFQIATILLSILLINEFIFGRKFHKNKGSKNSRLFAAIGLVSWYAILIIAFARPEVDSLLIIVILYLSSIIFLKDLSKWFG